MTRITLSAAGTGLKVQEYGPRRGVPLVLIAGMGMPLSAWPTRTRGEGRSHRWLGQALPEPLWPRLSAALTRVTQRP